MAYLFELVNNKAIPKTETLLIEPFKTIWERDDSEKKSKAVREFTFIELFTSFKKENPYKEYDEDLKYELLIKDIFKEDWKPDKLVEQGIEKIIKFQTEGSKTFNLYLSAVKAIDKIRDFFNSFDLSKTNKKTGNLILKPRDVTSALKDVDDLVEKMKKLRKKVLEELEEDDIRSRSNKVISKFSKIENFNV